MHFTGNGGRKYNEKVILKQMPTGNKRYKNRGDRNNKRSTNFIQLYAAHTYMKPCRVGHSCVLCIF